MLLHSSCARPVVLGLTLVLLSMTGVGCKKETPPAPPKPKIEASSPVVSDIVVERSTNVVKAMVSGNMAQVTSWFDATMKQALSPDTLRGVWNQTVNGKGNFVSMDAPRKQKFQGLDVVFVTCRFEHGAFDVQLTMDGQGLVSGLFFRPEGFHL